MFNSKQPDRSERLLQENLQTIRRLAGWSAEDLGARIGVTKQTISNLETKKTRLSPVQYVAIRTAFDWQIANDPGNTALSGAVKLLLDSADLLNDTRYKEIRNSASTVAAAAAGGAAADQINRLFSGLVSPSLEGTGLSVQQLCGGMEKGITDSLWLKRFFDK